jgi:hypothetical protein
VALSAQSVFLWGYEVTEFNSSIDFKSSATGAEFLATLTQGTYSATSLLQEVKRAMEAADPLHSFSATINRTVNSGTENRISIGTNGTYLDLLFLTGTRNASSADSLLGFNHADYTGATGYTGSVSSGTVLIPDYIGYNYLGPDFMRNVFGSLSVTAGGIKEAIVWQVQQFFQAEFKHEPQQKVIDEWMPFLVWAIQQRAFEFTPEITNPTVFYECTLESSPADGKGLGYIMQEQLPEMPFLYRTGLMKFRRKL